MAGLKQGVQAVADAWRPTSELERRLHEKARAGDQEGYFRALAEGELLVPVPPDLIDGLLTGETRPTWPTQEEDGRVHVLVYTSAAAMRACLGAARRHFMTLRFGDLAETWPDARWWLAVDVPAHGVTGVALPIEARLPAWFVRQVAAGDGRPPLVGPAAPRAAAHAEPPAPAAEAQAPVVPAPHEDAPAPAKPTAPAAPAAAAPAVSSAGHADSAPAPAASQGGHAESAPAADQPARPPSSGPAQRHDDPTVTRGDLPVPDSLPAPGAPAQDATAAQAGAASGDALRSNAAQDGPPQDGAEATPDRSARDGAEAAPETRTWHDPTATQTDLPVPAASLAPESPSAPAPASDATAVPAAPPAPGAASPAPAWQDPTVTRADLTGAGDDAGWEELQDQHRELPREEPRPPFHPANEVERELLRAAAGDDHDLFLQTMAGAEVLLPTPEDMDYTLRPGRPGFPWRTREVDGTTVLPVFTSPDRLIEASRASGGGTDHIKVPFTSVLRYWPDPAWALAINSGSPAGGTIVAQQLPGLAKWADQRAAQRMTEGFEPQNDVEQRLFEAARRRDTDAFFKVLLGAQVLVPADPETPWGVAPGDPEFPWRPVPVQGAVSLQVFTSLKWMNEAIGSSRFVMPSLLEMVSAWPDATWTLALNPGTPIAATMPGDQVRALSGTPRDVPGGPSVQPSTAASTAPPAVPDVPVEPAVPAEPAPPASTSGRPAPSRSAPVAGDVSVAGTPTTPPAPVTPTEPATPTRRAASPQPAAGPSPVPPAQPTTAPQAAAGPEAAASTGAAVPTQPTTGPQPATGPEPATPARLVTDPGSPASAQHTAGPQPAPGSEAAASAGTAVPDQPAAGPQPLASAQHSTGPQATSGPEAAASTGRAVPTQPATGPEAATPAQLATDPSSAASAHHTADPQVTAGAEAAAPTGLAASAEPAAGPSPTSAQPITGPQPLPDAGSATPAQPVADPDAAASARLAASAEPAAGPQPAAGARAAAEAEAEFEPGNRIDQELYEAALGGDSDAFLRVLLAANVLVPIPQDAPLEVTPVQREFRWDAALREDGAVRVFTSLVRLREVLPESRFVYADFRELIGAWPREDWAMLLNPGTRIGASLRGDQVRALSEWAVRVGLVQPRPASTLPSPQTTVQDIAVPEPSARPEPRPRPEALSQPGAQPEAFADPEPVVEARPVAEARPAAEAQPVPDPRADPLPEPRVMPDLDGDRVAQPTIMQKVVPHGHVSWYLEQGYDRVGGFVHPTGDVGELQTPVQLYEALGLLYEDSPFSPGDEGAYVIRWPAYCPDLYRVPFGGRDEAELAAWGDAGWVIERPPFLGTGFAPGSAGSIREYKVDSVRLPYGAEMYYLGADRSERFVAMYDPDRLAWLRPDAAAGADGRGGTEAAQ